MLFRSVPLLAGSDLPDYVQRTSDDDFECRMDEWAAERKEKVFDVSRGNGDKYIHFSELYNVKGDGLMQKSLACEKKIFSIASSSLTLWRNNGKVDEKGLSDLYDRIGKIVFENDIQ